MKMTLINYYDVWGNAADGWEVNDQFNEGDFEIPDNATPKQIITELFKWGYVAQPDLRKYVVEDTGSGIEIYAKKGNRPLFGLRLH